MARARAQQGRKWVGAAAGRAEPLLPLGSALSSRPLPALHPGQQSNTDSLGSRGRERSRVS